MAAHLKRMIKVVVFRLFRIFNGVLPQRAHVDVVLALGAIALNHRQLSFANHVANRVFRHTPTAGQFTGREDRGNRVELKRAYLASPIGQVGL